MAGTTIGREGYDELDRKIDDALDRVGAFVGFWLRVLLVLALIGGAVWTIFFSPWADTVGPIFITIASLMFQIAFAIVFVIIQFGAIFWFLGRGRMYWMMPGETGF